MLFTKFLPTSALVLFVLSLAACAPSPKGLPILPMGECRQIAKEMNLYETDIAKWPFETVIWNGETYALSDECHTHLRQTRY